jgi:hypothetical protein
MKNLSRYVSVFALSVYFITGVQQSYATKRLSSIEEEDRPSKVSKNSIENILEEIKDSKYISYPWLEKLKSLPRGELENYQESMTVDHKLFDIWITFILRAFPENNFFNISLERAKAKAESEQATLDARSNLGLMYQFGHGVPKDLKKAAELYKQAATEGHAFAQYNLGEMYLSEEKFEDHIKEAVDLYKVGSNKNLDDETCMELYQGDKALDLYTLAGNQGHIIAQVDLIDIYQSGDRFDINHAEALKWYFNLNKTPNLPLSVRNELKEEIKELVEFIPSTIVDAQEAEYKRKLAILNNTLGSRFHLDLLEQKRNNPDLNSKESDFAVPSLFKIYNQIVDFEAGFLTMLRACNNPGFMTNFLEPIHEEAFEENYFSDVKYYNIKGNAFLTFGKENIDLANKVKERIFDLVDLDASWNKVVQEILDIHMQVKRNYQVEALSIQSEYRKGLISEDQISVKKEVIKRRNNLIEELNQEIEKLNNLKKIPSQLIDLFFEGSPYRNKLYLQNNAHVASLFEDQ